MTLEAINARPPRRHTHKPNGGASDIRCPYCGQLITRQEFEKIRAKIQTEERARIAKAEETFKEKLAREQQQAAAKAKAEIEKAKREAATQIEKAKREAVAREAGIRQQATKAATAALAPKINEAVNAEKQRAYAEKLRLTEQLEDMKRRLEKKTAGELGDEAEMDLFSTLSREFPGDQIVRVPKGRTGADILHDVVHNGVIVGRIVFDSKNHARWSSRFVTKLASDLIEHHGDHAVLSSSVYPSRTRKPHVVDRVIVAHPAHVLVLTTLLRRQIIAVHESRIGNTARDEKRDTLYDFIVSDRCAQLLNRINSLSDDVLELDAKEESTHRTVWKRRAELIKAIQGAHSEIASEIEQIIGATDAPL
jgi:hypothetical protein